MPDAGPAPEVIDAVARIIADDAYMMGDRLHDWLNSGDNIRETFRAAARAAVAVLLGERPCPTHWPDYPDLHGHPINCPGGCGGSGRLPSLYVPRDALQELRASLERLNDESVAAMKFVASVPETSFPAWQYNLWYEAHRNARDLLERNRP